MVQDVRGRYASDGEFDPWFQETDDGADALTWAAGQPWSNGIAGTFGGSYAGLTQWLPARAEPPSMRAMSLAVTGSDMYEGMSYQGGAHVLHGLRGAVSIAPEQLRRRGRPAPDPAVDLDVDETLSQDPSRRPRSAPAPGERSQRAGPGSQRKS